MMIKFTERNQFMPDWVPCPGETLQELIDGLDWSQAELSRRMMRSSKFINELIQGKVSLKEETAIQLERVLGVRAGFWLALETEYQLFQAQLKEKTKLLVLKEWADEFPFAQMASLGWIEDKSDVAEKVQALLKFFGIATPDAWDSQWQKEKLCASFRAASYTVKVKSVAAWLRQGQLLAAHTTVDGYDKQKFTDALFTIRELSSVVDAKIFVPQLKNVCAKCGVTVFFVPELKGTTISGAAHWYSGKPIIQLTLRYKTNDHLWFSFFHEAKHILSHSTREIYINGENNNGCKEEIDANNFSANFLIPNHEYVQFISKWNKKDISAIQIFADSIKIHPGIIVGRLQHDKVLQFTQCNNFKIKYKWAV